MNMPEGSTTLNVPELRRLLEEAQKTRAAYSAAIAERRDAPSEAQAHDPYGLSLTRLALRTEGTRDALGDAAVNALPALLDAAERVEKLERVAAAAQAVSEDSDTVGGPTWVPVSKGVFEAMREALAALGEAGPS